jgi:hypothetical protein
MHQLFHHLVLVVSICCCNVHVSKVSLWFPTCVIDVLHMWHWYVARTQVAIKVTLEL